MYRHVGLCDLGWVCGVADSQMEGPGGDIDEVLVVGVTVGSPPRSSPLIDRKRGDWPRKKR